MRDIAKMMLLAGAVALRAQSGWCAGTAVLPGPGGAQAERLERGPRGVRQGQGRQKGERSGRRQDRVYPPPAQAWPVATLILGCPTDRQISVSVTTAADVEGYVAFGADGAPLSRRTEPRLFTGTKPELLILDGLQPDAACQYRFCYRKPGEPEFQEGPIGQFHTQRAPGARFTFEIQGDSHPERSPKQHDPNLYEQTLLAAARDRPDFYICMGDDFSVDTLREITAASVEQVYRRQLPYLGLVARSAPLFLVNGNHEQAALCNHDGTATNVAVWAQTSRNRFYPQPAPDGFYGGDRTAAPHIGLLRDYYAWTWGDALFVVIDPYWHSKVTVDNSLGGSKARRDLWQVTLGDEQYQWLKTTLEESHARFKFVFAHHVNGTGRGGIEQADGYEWGGDGPNGVEDFKNRRPGWDLPIHSLMVREGVTIFFQGHDHIFAHQEKDGVVYQTVPEPADPNYTLYNAESYRSGDRFSNSGRVRVTVDSGKVLVEYVRSWLPGSAPPGHSDGEVAFSYSVTPQAKP